MKNINKKAISIVEYMVLFIIIIAAFLIMRNNIQRGLFGAWASSGQSFGFGRQYDSQKTIECSYDPQSNIWYDYNCYKYYTTVGQCNGDPGCEESVITGGSCLASSCAQLNNGASP